MSLELAKNLGQGKMINDMTSFQVGRRHQRDCKYWCEVYLNVMYFQMFQE